MQNESQDLEMVEATIKLAVLPFTTAVTLSVAEYMEMLNTGEYKGQKVSGILMQHVGSNQVWRDGVGRVIINPNLTGTEADSDDSYSDPASGN